MLGGTNHAVDEPSQAQSQPSAEDVRAELERLVASLDFDPSARARRLLSYIVEETLAGQADRIKACSVGTEMFERDSRRRQDRTGKIAFATNDPGCPAIRRASSALPFGLAAGWERASCGMGWF